MKRTIAAFSAILFSWGCGGTGEVVSPQTPGEISAERVLIADSLLIAGDGEEASRLYLSAALLFPQGDVQRLQLALKAAEATSDVFPAAARILLESDEDIAPFLAVRLGGPDVAGDVLPGLLAGKYVLPEYVALMAAESLLKTDPLLAAEFLAHVHDLPGTAGDDLLLARYRASLYNGDRTSQESLWNAALGRNRDVLMSRFYHHRGLARGSAGIPDLIQSFNLWPAGDIHATAYSAIRDSALCDSSLASSLADPFYAGGLWNEVYDMAVNSPNPSAHIVYLGARTRDRLGMYSEAVALLRMYLERWPGGEDAPDAAINLGRSLAAMGLVEEAMAQLDMYERTWPGHFRISNLPWYRGILLAENGFWDESIPWFEKTVRDYPLNSTADDAQFHICLALMKTGRTEQAMEAFGNFNARWTESVYRPSSRFWYGYLMLESGDGNGRGVLERLITDKPESLPAAFAREYLGIPPWQPEFIEEPIGAWMARNDRPEAQPTQNALNGLVLLRAGCRKWALDLFLAAEEEVGDVYRLAPFYLANDVWERGPSAAWRIWSLEGDKRPLDLWRLRYPAAWPEEVISASERFGMDPLLLWAIMKQESAFQPSCYSTAGARGLIQMIPSTSEYVAEQNGWSDTYSPDILYDPATSIMYGTACISGYGANCGGDVLETLASYNGGPHNAARWGMGDASAREFFSRISFNETKKYVEIVSNNYVIYKQIWPEYN